MSDAQESKSNEGRDEQAEGMGTDRTPPADHYLRPGWFTRNVFNRLVARLTRVGLSIWGSRVLEVRGRSTGNLQRVPVNVLELDGNRYLVSARGEGQWV